MIYGLSKLALIQPFYMCETICSMNHLLPCENMMMFVVFNQRHQSYFIIIISLYLIGNMSYKQVEVTTGIRKRIRAKSKQNADLCK